MIKTIFNPSTGLLEKVYYGKGSQGEMGPQGERGIQGPKGDQGDIGPRGEQGLRGHKGDKGEPGPIGKTGPRGMQGDKGDIGPAGKDGLNGDPGTKILRTIAAPENFLGRNGDWVFTELNEIYYKEDGQWKFFKTFGGGGITRAMVNSMLSSVSSSGGTLREINNISTNQTLAAVANTDYVYFCSGTITITMPTAVGNENRYTIKNVDTGVITINFTGGQSADGSTSMQLTSQYESVDFASTNSNWMVI
jgi:hypothetical protein